MEIDVGYGTGGFFFNSSGLQTTNGGNGFEGWLGKYTFGMIFFFRALGLNLGMNNG